MSWIGVLLNAVVRLTAAGLVLSALAGAGSAEARSGPSWPTSGPNVCTAQATGWCGDGGPATEARLASPASIVALPEGGFVFVDKLNGVIRTVDQAGRIATLPAKGPAARLLLGCPLGQIAREPDGTLLAAGGVCQRVFSISPVGMVSVIAGNGKGPEAYQVITARPGRALAAKYEDRPAPSVPLGLPLGIARLAGDTYIADWGALRRIDDNGRIHSVQLDRPVAMGSLAVTAAGQLLANAYQQIWSLSLDGMTTLVAGRPLHDAPDPDTSATRKRLGFVTAILPAPDGATLLADAWLNRVWRVSDGGEITTAVGTGHAGYRGDGEAAVDAEFWGPNGLAFAPDGALLVSDAGNARIRRVDRDGLVQTVAGGGMPWPGVEEPIAEADAEPCLNGCGGVNYEPLFNYFYLLNRPLHTTPRAPLRLSIVSSRACRITLRASRQHRRLTWHFKVRAGQSSVELHGRRQRSTPLPPGRYRLTITARVAGGQQRIDTHLAIGAS